MIADYLWIRHDLKMKTKTKKEPTVVEKSDVLAKKVSKIWIRVVKYGLEHPFPL
jgi:hypothetical protein